MEQLHDLLTHITWLSVLVRIALSVLIGGLIGSERGRHGRAAGLRTHILVCLGSTLAALVGFYAHETLQLGNDPLRVSAQVISGVGFLGAGTILTKKNAQVTGLTTAAGIWATGCIGVVLGAGFYLAAVMGSAAALLTNSVFVRWERSDKLKNSVTYYAELCDISYVNGFYAQYSTDRVHVQMVPAYSQMADHVGMELICTGKEDDAQHFLEQLRTHPGVLCAVPITTKS